MPTAYLVQKRRTWDGQDVVETLALCQSKQDAMQFMKKHVMSYLKTTYRHIALRKLVWQRLPLNDPRADMLSSIESTVKYDRKCADLAYELGITEELIQATSVDKDYYMALEISNSRSDWRFDDYTYYDVHTCDHKADGELRIEQTDSIERDDIYIAMLFE